MTLRHHRARGFHQQQAQQRRHEGTDGLQCEQRAHIREQQNEACDHPGDARGTGFNGDQPAEGSARARAPLPGFSQVRLRVVQQRQVRPGHQAHTQPQDELVYQEVAEALRPQQPQEPEPVQDRAQQQGQAPPPDVGDVARRDLQYRHGQREQGLGLQDLGHGQAVALHKRHENGYHHHEAQEEPHQVDDGNIQFQGPLHGDHLFLPGCPANGVSVFDKTERKKASERWFPGGLFQKSCLQIYVLKHPRTAVRTTHEAGDGAHRHPLAQVCDHRLLAQGVRGQVLCSETAHRSAVPKTLTSAYSPRIGRVVQSYIGEDV